VLAFFFGVDGFLLYGYQRSLPSTGNVDVTDRSAAGVDSTVAGETIATAQTTASENTMGRTGETVTFAHRAMFQNITDNSTYVDDPLANVGLTQGPSQQRGF